MKVDIGWLLAPPAPIRVVFLELNSPGPFLCHVGSRRRPRGYRDQESRRRRFFAIELRRGGDKEANELFKIENE